MINEDDEIKEFVTRFLEAGIQGKEAKMGLDAALGAVELLAARRTQALTKLHMSSQVDLGDVIGNIRNSKTTLEFMERSIKMIRRVTSVIQAFKEQEEKILESEQQSS